LDERELSYEEGEGGGGGIRRQKMTERERES